MNSLHIKNHDTLTMTVTATLAGSVSLATPLAGGSPNGNRSPVGVIGSTMISRALAALIVQRWRAVAEYEPTASAREISPASNGLRYEDRRRP